MIQAGPQDDYERQTHLAYWAWTIIANVPWDDMPEDWVTAAKTWRDAFHAELARAAHGAGDRGGQDA